ncbi:CHAT domain-containing protein [Nonomuraea typhae]|uniref:CHAT domain-containing protein n=1 Tax=Nonomuraea typhae TaxID=2603600 RepID=A0ABW7Z9M3_9ACTN
MSYVMYVQHDEEGPSRSLPADRYHPVRSALRRWVKPSSLRLNRRGTRHHARYRSTGRSAELDRALRDLCEAAWGRAPYAGHVDTGRAHWAEYANNFAVALVDAFRHDGNIEHLDNAIPYLRRALSELPDDTPARARVLGNLIAAVEERPAVPPAKADLPDVTDLRRELSTTVSAPVADRLAAARAWGYAAAESTRPAEGLAGLEIAVELLPRAAWWGHRRDTRERLLAEHIGLAADAAACAVDAGQPALALELLEGGRAVLWTQLLRTRTDRTALRQVAPRLAKRMDRVAAALERDRGMPADKRMALVARWSRMDERAGVRLEREWDSLARRAQEALPEGAFIRPEYGSDLGPAGAEGPVVVVNVSRLGCCALIVRDGEEEPQVVGLPGLTYDDASAHAQKYVTEGRDREEVVGATLGWIWESVVSPVLDALGYREQEQESWPRLWWCPTGPLMTLPLHAAGKVLDCAVSSYTPALKVLVRARKARDTPPDDAAEGRLLHVAVGDGPGQESLPGAARTRGYLERLLPADRRTTLDGQAATWRSVETGLRRHVWTHFDCHGVQDLNNPFQGGLVLHDRTLTVADLAGIRHDRAEFAFLAACTTAIGGARVPDESITLTAALQHAGYQSVIGTLWTVPDRPAARIAQAVYGTLVHDGRLQPAESARALHAAIRAERARSPRHPSAWAPFLHVGL